MNAPEQLPVDRKSFIGGSDAAAIIGVSPWATPLDIYLLKTGQKFELVDPKKEKIFRRGKREEPRVIDDLVEDFGIKVTKRSSPEAPNRYISPDFAFLAAEIDFEWEVTPEVARYYDLPEELVGTTQNGEVKTVHQFAAGKFGEAETDEVPIEYAAQAMHGLMVTERQLTMFAVRIGFDIIVYWIKRDEETVTSMQAKEVAFWTDHVLAGVPPEPVNVPDVFELFRREPTIRIEGSLEAIDAWQALQEYRNAERVAKEGQEDAKFKIGKFMLGEAAIARTKKRDGTDGDIVATPEAKKIVHALTVDGVTVLEIALQQTTRIDNDTVRAKHPEIVAECSKQTSFFKFQSPRKGKTK